MTAGRAQRYVAWLDRRRVAMFVASVVAIAVSAYLVAFHLPLRAAFTYLLPADAPSVRAFDELGSRMPARDRMLIVVTAPDPATRSAVAGELASEVRKLPADLVDHVETDDADLRDFVREHRFLYAPLPDLEAARDFLDGQLAAAMNPLASPPDPGPLLAKLRAHQPGEQRSRFVTPDGSMQAMVVHTSFVATDVDRDHRLQSQVDAVAAKLRAVYPGVAIGFTGGITNTVIEHAALVRGVLLSTLITGALVAFVLFVHLRSGRLLGLLVANITAATLVGFGIAALTVGHLNAATAFLGAIIAGNGVNYGILLVARFGEERRVHDARSALARAIAGTLRPTLVASLGAAIAYGALAATRFRGFADFAVIGGVAMLVCWIASFTLLPVLILRFAHAPRRAGSPVFGGLVVRVFGFRRPAIVCAISAVAVVLVTIVSWRYLASDPYEYDMTQLRSKTRAGDESRAWQQLADTELGRGLAGLASQTYVAVDDASDVPNVVAELREASSRDPIIGTVSSIADAVPEHQAAKLAALDRIRRDLDVAAPHLAEPMASQLRSLRPPDDLHAITVADLPRSIASQLTERDGHVGRVIAVRPGESFDELDGRQLIQFANAVRSIRASHHASIAGGSLLFADVLLQIQRDGPVITGIAAIGLVVMVVLVVGRNRRAVAVLIASAAGSLAMIAVCAIAGLEINFLDFVALPITLGLGIDYAINIADRVAEGAITRDALRSTGGTVFVCSLTTIIGYTSLLVSDNLAIRGFGLASLIGEITCVIAALVIVPAVMSLGRARLQMDVEAEQVHVDVRVLEDLGVGVVAQDARERVAHRGAEQSGRHELVRT